MANFVLVHGSWAGGWQWTTIREMLEEKGHRVLTPTLTGMSDRHHLISEDVGLETHIDDIARLIEWERLDDVILGGHSYGGMVITGVAAKVQARLSHLVYFDAFLPRAGDKKNEKTVGFNKFFRQNCFFRHPADSCRISPVISPVIFAEGS